MRDVKLLARIGLAVAASVGVSGCSAWDSGTNWLDRGTSSVAQGVASAGDAVGAPWGGMRPGVPSDSRTVQRVQGVVVPTEPLLPEAGNVWPEAEAPRATLRNPDQAMRGIEEFRPATPVGRPSSELQSPPQQGPASRLRGSGVAETPALPPMETPRQQVPPAFGQANVPPAAVTGGSIIHTPQGPGVISSGAGRSGAVTLPGGGTGTYYQDGQTTIITGPTGQSQTFTTPR